MIILFSYIVMRVTGVITFNSVISRNEFSPSIKGMFVFMLSAMMFIWNEGLLYTEPETLLEYGVLLVKELAVGACIGFGMDITFAVVRFGGTVIDFVMGLNMAQVFDPGSNQQSTPTSNLLAMFMSMVFFTSGGHIRYIRILFNSVKFIPFGQVQLNFGIARYMFELFFDCMVLGLQIAFPILAIELLSEISLGILMRINPQLNIFSVNFQLKIIAGMVMLLVLFTPMSEMIIRILEGMFTHLDEIVRILAG
ncbi:MAG: flagellar biosynthetic protein FliR [Oribacterium sp.]|nr:flagellar biosynthetic protein FliR [Oribacterium sp.]